MRRLTGRSPKKEASKKPKRPAGRSFQLKKLKSVRLRRKKSIAIVEPDSEFSDNLRNNWINGIVYACKDVPRLAGRVTILTDRGVILRDGRILPKPEPLHTDDEPSAATLTLEGDDIKEALTADLAAVKDTETIDELAETEEKSLRYSLPTEEQTKLESSSPKALKASASADSILRIDITDSSGDLGSKEIEIKVSSEQLEPLEAPSSSPEAKSKKLKQSQSSGSVEGLKVSKKLKERVSSSAELSVGGSSVSGASGRSRKSSRADSTEDLAKILPRKRGSTFASTVIFHNTAEIDMGALSEFPTTDDKEDGMPNIGSPYYFLNVIQVLLEELDPASEAVNLFRNASKEYSTKRETSEGLDNEKWMNKVVDSILAETCAMKVMNAVHQKMVIPCVIRLKTKAFGSLTGLRDVRDSDGWKVLIEIRKAGYIAVTHLRKEQAPESPDSPKHWKVAWEVRLSFDREMKDLRANILRITDLEFNENMEKGEREKIEAQLVGDLII